MPSCQPVWHRQLRCSLHLEKFFWRCHEAVSMYTCPRIVRHCHAHNSYIIRAALRTVFIHCSTTYTIYALFRHFFVHCVRHGRATYTLLIHCSGTAPCTVHTKCGAVVTHCRKIVRAMMLLHQRTKHPTNNAQNAFSIEAIRPQEDVTAAALRSPSSCCSA